MSNPDSKSPRATPPDNHRLNEIAAYQDELVLGDLLDSSVDEDGQSRTLAEQGFDFANSRRDWSELVEQLSLAVPPSEPEPSVLASLLKRIEFDKRAAVPETEFPSNQSATREDAKKSLVIHRASEGRWRSAGQTGAYIRILNHDRALGRSTFLLKIDAGCRFPTHDHDANEECIVLSGDIQDGELSFGPGDYFRAAAGSRHAELSTREGCVCMITTAVVRPDGRANVNLQ